MFASSILGQLNRKNEKHNSNKKVQYVTQVPMAFTADSSPTQDQRPQSNECFLDPEVKFQGPKPFIGI